MRAQGGISTEQLVACLDLTSLDGEVARGEIVELCRRALEPAAGLPHVAAVCVTPARTGWAALELADSPVATACVVAFPDGTVRSDERVRQIEQAADDGATEIDSVLPPDVLEDPQRARSLLRAERTAAGGLVWKLIIESGRLTAQQVRSATRSALDAGTDFIKTSTGRVDPGATPEAVRTICEEIARSGSSAGIKVSGGIREPGSARVLAGIVAEVLGQDALVPARFRIGASGLLDALVRERETGGRREV